MPVTRTCTSCGCDLSETPLNGLCPGCLLRAGLLKLDAVTPSLPNIAGYELLEEIGVGGMGVVYKAEQREPIRRTVAIKLIKLGMDTRELITRFEAERQALATLNHPNVAAAYHADATDTGRPYFVMEYVPGEPITAFCDRHNHTTRQRLELFIQACEGIQHAHQKAIIHRDLKPSNLLVWLDTSDADRAPRPLLKVIDFGVAKVTAPNRVHVTEAGQFVGTPEYMSPEQAEMNPFEVDTRSDIYSLGVVLYELLAKRLPHERITQPTSRATRTIRQGEPIRLGALDRALRGDVETIVAKAMMKEREQRYSSVAELTTDIRRYLDDQPITARRPTVTYQLRKFARRNKLIVASTILLLAALSLGTAGTAMGLLKARRERDVARAARQSEQVQREVATANQQRAEAQELLAQQRLAQNLVTTGRTLLKSGEAARARDSFEEAWDLERMLKISEVPAVAGLLAAQIASPPPLIEIDVKPGPSPDDAGAPTTNLCVAFSRDGRRLFSGGSDGSLHVWEVATGAHLTTLRCEKGYFRSVAAAPDGRMIVTGGTDGLITLWDSTTYKKLATLRGHTERVSNLTFTNEGRSLLSASWDHSIRVWDLPSRSETAVLRGHSRHVYQVALLPDDRCLSVAVGGEVKLWDLRGRRELATLSGVADEDRTSVAIPRDQQIAIIAAASGLETWDLRSNSLVSKWPGHSGAVYAVTVTPDGRRAASVGVDGAIIIWDLPGKTESRRLTGHKGMVRGLTFSPDGRLLVSAGDDGRIRLWAMEGGGECVVARGHQDRITSVFASRDGLTAATGSFDGTIQLWDLASGMSLRSVRTSTAKIWSIALFADGHRVLLGGEDRTLRVVDLADSTELLCLRGHTGVVTGVALSPDERFAVSSSRDATVRLWDLSKLEAVRTFKGHRQYVRSAGFSPDGRSIISAGFDNTLRVWDVATGAATQTLTGHRHFVHGAQFSTDGTTAMSWSWDLSLATWNLASRERIRHLTGPTSWICAGAWSRDGRVIAAGTQDGQLWLWDETSDEPASNFKAHSDVLTAIALLPDGRVLTTGRDKVMNVYDLSRPAEYRRFAQRLPSAHRALERNPNDAAALAEFGSWYAFRGFHQLAAELFERARSNGAEVSSLALARCYWRMSKPTEAEREFRLARDRGEANTAYLDLCLNAVTRAKSSSPAPRAVIVAD